MFARKNRWWMGVYVSVYCMTVCLCLCIWKWVVPPLGCTCVWERESECMQVCVPQCMINAECLVPSAELPLLFVLFGQGQCCTIQLPCVRTLEFSTCTMMVTEVWIRAIKQDVSQECTQMKKQADDRSFSCYSQCLWNNENNGNLRKPTNLVQLLRLKKELRSWKGDKHWSEKTAMFPFTSWIRKDMMCWNFSKAVRLSWGHFSFFLVLSKAYWKYSISFKKC